MRKRVFVQALLAASCWPEAVALSGGASAEAPALLLAKSAPGNLNRLQLGDYLVSEKLDGVRAFWTGQALLTRKGLRIAAPAWFTAKLPATPLDGELWLARGQFEAASATVRRQQPIDEEWQRLNFMLFELPGAPGSFAQRAARLASLAAEQRWANLQAVAQIRVGSAAELRARLDQVVRFGGEGLVLHRADAIYSTGRSEVLLKLKPEDDEEAEVLAQLPGAGRLAGLLGALLVRNREGQEFKLGSGFSEAQRADPPAVGATVVYRFRGLTAKGLPRFATFVRVAEL
ncbi:DNA ligase [Paucibacter sp. KCTC 42545]|uniref:DNA ligase n=1 Tax=Paucibacter sp. KCTC 42545 TaxID=1768242 RepID=UPI000733B2B5|nr:DNA ligase [Paucibacter sp. KCTC 42545]ALT77397.1 ATP-dependent DNA ligase [Paucibacter sp. KCTC 42545]